MIRRTFANIRSHLAPGTEGGVTKDFTDGGETTSVYEAAQHYRAEGIPQSPSSLLKRAFSFPS